MDGTRLIDGEFWVPGTDYGRRSGFLKLGPQRPPILEVDYELTPGMREVKREKGADGNHVVTLEPVDDEIADRPFLIHGVDSVGTKLTLMDALTIQRTFSSEPKHRLQAAKVVVGGHLTNRERLFNS